MVGVWATIAGLDLVSVLQVLLSRPLVAGSVAGWLLGDVDSGLRIGAALELFALDVVPVGSSRYPDFGAATVGAVLYGAGTDWTATLGASVGIGIMLAILGGATLPATRRLNARIVRGYAVRLAEGDPRAVRAVHLAGLTHDLVRSAMLGLGAVGVALLARRWLAWPAPMLGQLLTAVALAGGAWAVGHGAAASARTGPRWRWAIAGLAIGLILVGRP